MEKQQVLQQQRLRQFTSFTALVKGGGNLFSVQLDDWKADPEIPYKSIPVWPFFLKVCSEVANFALITKVWITFSLKQFNIRQFKSI